MGLFHPATRFTEEGKMKTRNSKIWKAILLSMGLVGLGLMSTVMIRDFSDSENTDSGTVPFVVPMVYTYTVTFDDSVNNVSNRVITTTVYYSDSLHFRMDSKNGSELRNGPEEVRNNESEGLVYSYSEVDRPIYLGLSPMSPPDSMCDKNGTPFLDLEAVEMMEAGGEISITETTDWFGRPVSIAEKDNDIHLNPLRLNNRCVIWYDEDTGFRYQIEGYGEVAKYDTTYTVVDIDFGWSVEEGKFIYTEDTQEANRVIETRIYDDDAEIEFPFAANTIVEPLTLTFAGGYHADPMLYLHNREVDERLSYWALVQRIVGPTGKEVVVAQAVDSAETQLPILGPYWPRSDWNMGIPPGVVDSYEEELNDDTAIEVFEFDVSNGPSGRLLATWVTENDLRIAFVGNSQVSDIQEFIDLINQYLGLE